ncbi:hypothetical protein A7J67_09130 [Achromobacter xylosoxidans]|nr:hypothetical protein A7J67_09130 [Achromobacter xylosoxidans]
MRHPANSSSCVLVTARFFDDKAANLLRTAGLTVLTGGVAHDAVDAVISEAMHDALARCSAWIMGIPPVTADLLARYPNLSVMARRGVGYDTIDVAAVQAHRRLLTITPGSNEATVADHAVGLMLAAGRRYFESHRRMQSGKSGVSVGTELSGKTVGLVGLGRIARLVARRLAGFDVRVMAHDPYLHRDVADLDGVQLASLDTVLADSDFISLHAPLNDSTRRLIDRHALARMKPSSILINTARGELVDDAALLAALKGGRLAGAGLDVVGSEHDASLEAITRELLTLPNVICTQHTGGSSREGLARANMRAAQCVIAALQGQPLPPDAIVVDARSP